MHFFHNTRFSFIHSSYYANSEELQKFICNIHVFFESHHSVRSGHAWPFGETFQKFKLLDSIRSRCSPPRLTVSLSRSSSESGCANYYCSGRIINADVSLVAGSVRKIPVARGTSERYFDYIAVQSNFSGWGLPKLLAETGSISALCRVALDCYQQWPSSSFQCNMSTSRSPSAVRAGSEVVIYSTRLRFHRLSWVILAADCCFYLMWVLSVWSQFMIPSAPPLPRWERTGWRKGRRRIAWYSFWWHITRRRSWTI